MNDSSHTSVWNCDGEVINDTEVFIRYAITIKNKRTQFKCLKVFFCSQIAQTFDKCLSAWPLQCSFR